MPEIPEEWFRQLEEELKRETSRRMRKLRLLQTLYGELEREEKRAKDLLSRIPRFRRVADRLAAEGRLEEAKAWEAGLQRLIASYRRALADIEYTRRDIEELKADAEEELKKIKTLQEALKKLKPAAAKYWKSYVVCSARYLGEQGLEDRFEIHEIIPSVKEPDFTKGEDFTVASNLQLDLLREYSEGQMDELLAEISIEMNFGLVETKEVKKFYPETEALIIETTRGVDAVRRYAKIKWRRWVTLEGEPKRTYVDIMLLSPFDDEVLEKARRASEAKQTTLYPNRRTDAETILKTEWELEE